MHCRWYVSAFAIRTLLTSNKGIHKKYTKTQRDDLFARLLVYKKWLLQKIFKVAESDDIGAILVLPIEHGKPNYRDDIPV
jgi:hypothetical protein